MEFGSWSTRELLIASFAGVRGAITLAGVLSIPLLLPTGDVFRHVTSWYSWRQASFCSRCLSA
ncbi:hypothetical protein ACP3P6_01875 [Enterobacter mori]